VDTLYTIGFREVSGLNSFKNFSNLTTDCEDIAYWLVGYFILSHPVDDMDFGFMKGKETIDVIFIVRQMQEKFRLELRKEALFWLCELGKSF